MSTTENLNLPYILAAQAQKHVTHNEALRMLDAITQLGVETLSQTVPPSAPETGQRFIVGAGAEEAFAGHENEIAAWQDGAWAFYVPRKGWRAYVADAGSLAVFDGSVWSSISQDAPLDQLGINTGADETHRFSVSSPYSLLGHEGDDHRMIVDKAQTGDTASVIFQTGRSGRAEFGLAGDDDFSVKVSPDGANWHEAIRVDRETAAVRFPGGVANPPLSGIPEDITAFDRLYLDAANGDDSRDGSSAVEAVRTPLGLLARLPVGRKVEIRLLSDVVWDQLLAVGYVMPALLIFGRNASDTAYEKRKITVRDAVNHPSHPGGFLLQSFASVYLYNLTIELDTSRGQAFINFYNTLGFLRTNRVTLERSGNGLCCMFANGSSFVPSQHTNTTISLTAEGYVAMGVGAGSNPNADWRYPSNLTSF